MESATVCAALGAGKVARRHILTCSTTVLTSGEWAAREPRIPSQRSIIPR